MAELLSATSMNNNTSDHAVCSHESVERNALLSNVVKCNCSAVNDASSTASSTSGRHTPESANVGQQTSSCGMKQRFGSIFNCERGSDVTFFVGQEPNVRTIYGHRVVLAVGSKTFELMFNGHWNAKVIEIVMPDDDPTTFFALVRYVYTDEVMVTVDTVVSVLNLAKYYHISALEKKCFTFFTDNLKPDNVFFLLNQTVELKEDELSNICLEKIDDCIAALILSEDFSNLDIETLCVVLKRDTLKMEEVELFEAVVKWSKAESRRKNLPQRTVLEKPLSLIRFPLMTAKNFALKVVPLGLLSKDQIDDMFVYFIGAQNPTFNFSTTPRTGLRQRLAFRTATSDDSSDASMSCDGNPSSASDSTPCEEVSVVEAPNSHSIESSSCEEFVGEGVPKSQNERVPVDDCDEICASNENESIEPSPERIEKTGVEEPDGSKKSQVFNKTGTGPAGRAVDDSRKFQKNKTIEPLQPKTGRGKTNVRRTHQEIKMSEPLPVKTRKIKAIRAHLSRKCRSNESVEPLPTKTGKSGAKKTEEEKYECAHCSTKFLLKSKLISHLKSHSSRKLFSCATCPAQFFHKSSLQRHLINHTGVKPFSCLSCSAKFLHKYDLALHGKKIHSVQKPLSCATCLAKFACKSDLARHVRNHFNVKLFSCASCPAKFTRKDMLLSHIRNHTGEKPYSCATCSAKFSCKSVLVHHVKSHLDVKPFSCVSCPAKFTRKDRLISHIRNHTGERPFSCATCPAKFSCKSYLARHVKRHSGIKSYLCVACPAKFFLKNNLNRHLTTHLGIRPFLCPSCPAKFSRKSYLACHKKIHTHRMPFSCHRCPAKYFHKGSLSRHMKIHSGPQLFSCATCPAKFSHERVLVRHVRTHLNIQPFSCATCPAKFSRKSDLAHHVKSHSSVKSFSCTSCPAIFFKKSNLNTHLKIHMGVEPFSCLSCPAKFVRKYNLICHAKVHLA